MTCMRDSDAMLDYARRYVRRGLPVFPLKPKTKRPLGQLVPHGFKDATTDETKIGDWWRVVPSAGIGIPTGAASGLLVLDVDPRSGGDATLATLLDEHGPLPETSTSRTGGGGRHILFRYLDVPIGCSVSRLGPGLDVKADGGYIVAPPSLHPSGQCYAWDEAATGLADVPPWLLERLTLPTPLLGTRAEASGLNAQTAAKDVRHILSYIPARPDYATWLRIIAGVLDKLGGDATAAEALLKAWSPEEEEGEYARKLDSSLERVGFGSVVRIARSYGYQPPKRKGQGQATSNRRAEKEREKDTPLPLDEAPPIRPDVYDHLPPLLAETADTFKLKHERDLFLSAALATLSSCLPNVAGYYGHNAELLRPHLYVCGVAVAAGGKGVAKWGERLVRLVNEALREEAQLDRAAWEARRKQAEEAGAPFEEPAPPETGSLLLPANASAAAFHKALADRGGSALAVETEIDTLLNALGQEWGKYDDTLRKAYHHERVSYLRKGEEVSIPEPALALVLTGTESQARRLFPTSEHGTYSRFILYYFMASLRWVDQRPTTDAAKRGALFDHRATEVLRLFQTLRERRETLLFELAPEHWDRQEETFAPMLKKLSRIGAEHLADVVKRAGVTAFRVAMVLRVLRAHSHGEPLGDEVSHLKATNEDVEAALWLACTWCDHALRFGLTLHQQPAPRPADERLKKLLPHLDAQFTTNEAAVLAEETGMDVNERTILRDLRHAEKLGWVRSLKKGTWEQVEESSVSILSDVSVEAG